MIRINVTDDQGVLLDTLEVSREEFFSAQRNPVAAQALLNQIEIGGQS